TEKELGMFHKKSTLRKLRPRDQINLDYSTARRPYAGLRAILDIFLVTSLAERRYFAVLVHYGDHLTRRLLTCLSMRSRNSAWLATECSAGSAFVFASERGLFEIAKTIKQDSLCGIFC